MYNETALDPKLKLIAFKAGTTHANAIATWCAMLCHASNNTDEKRGTLAGWSDDDYAFHIGIDRAVIFAIRKEMEGRLLDGDTVIAWASRQYESDDAAARKRKQRERSRNKDGENQQLDLDVTGHDRDSPATVPALSLLRSRDRADTDQNIGSLRSPHPATPPAPGAGRGKAVPKGKGQRDYSDDFLLFWDSFPRKVDKPLAWKSFQGALKRGADFLTILECLDSAKAGDWAGRTVDKIPHPSTWLNRDPWDTAGLSLLESGSA